MPCNPDQPVDESMNCENSMQLDKPTDSVGKEEKSGKEKLRRWINRQMKIEMTDGRILIGVFLCTDRDGNIILGSCSESQQTDGCYDEPRLLGLVMVPGRHVVSLHLAPSNNSDGETT
ncbi:N-alpha-acetyltransferase 38, NatC auxiliary subunit isoform X2 [Nilaparvata lugens]|uniref:N-alpha-acetyltransferase 38, NatC auxiliary subunit isoform X2 n=1 Tax=Nilaparvata lugens TaxID=108931 RepID=UPI00193E5EF5|nr:N-alpha-acetyltransferase 38, NatC auxiliary subunit isoform X2 [Nilaparvata lugens]